MNANVRMKMGKIFKRKHSYKETLAGYGPDEKFDESVASSGLGGISLSWIGNKGVRILLRICALISLVSVCLNTPHTFKRFPPLQWVTLGIDIFCAVLFIAELFTKIRIKGFIKGDNSFIRDRWMQFDSSMVIFIWISVILQLLEVTSVVPAYSYWSVLRAPRPLILIRAGRVFLKFQLPKNRINSILQRSSSQIYNVTIFFLFFMSLYGILGVQFFGELTFHCVTNDTDPYNVYMNNLMIPDTYCSPEPTSGYQCPERMRCMELYLDKARRSFNGFDDIATSIFTVYEAASQEGWVFIMYRAIDSLPSWRAFCYFVTMIFFLAWLVKNVFIAVIIETFAEIRVQFQQMWGARGNTVDTTTSQVLEKDRDGLKLVTIDENKPRGLAPPVLQKILKSSWFNMGVMFLVLANAIVTSTITHSPNPEHQRAKIKIYYYIEIAFTILFVLEALLKIWCLGISGYLRRSLHKFELFLAIGTMIHILPGCYQTQATYFQVLRIVRLMKASPILEDFVKKVRHFETNY